MARHTGIIYLNNAATAWPRARGVSQAMQRALREVPEHPGRTVSRACNVVVECRERLAVLFGHVDPSRIALTANATHALNLAIRGARLDKNSHVVTSVMEHNSVLRPLAHAQQEFGFRMTVVGLTETLELDHTAFEQALEDSPALVALTHASNVTGRINDVATLFGRAKAAGALTLLDVSQSLGHTPVHPAELHADLVAFTGHKGLRGPAGTGGLYVAQDLELQQVFVGGTGVRSDLHFHPTDMPMRLEAGTPNVPALAGLAAALRWRESGGTAFDQQEARRTAELREGLRTIDGIEVFDDSAPAPRTPIVSIRIRGWDIDEAGFILNESFGIVSRTGLHCAPLIHEAIGSAPHGTIRLSPSGFTKPWEIEATVAALRRLTQ